VRWESLGHTGGSYRNDAESSVPPCRPWRPGTPGGSSRDLRVGGDYHIVFVTKDGTECSFRGTYLEVEPPTRTVETWLFEGWPGVEAVESTELREAHGVTTLTQRLAFRDQAGRDHMNKTDGFEASYDNVEDLLRSLLEPQGTVSG
jgi:uncharacterized protein YndB with AHSA1/START domain